MGEGKIVPLTTPTPLNRQLPNIAHMLNPPLNPPHPHATFGQDHARVTSPKPKLPLNFFSLYAKSFHGPRAWAVEPILTHTIH